MSGLSPGSVLPSDMNQRQFSEWCRSQGIEAIASDAIAAHVAEADPHTGYVLDAGLTAAIAALNLASGTYTPTLTNVANLTGSTAFQCQYLRVGTVVTVSGRVDLNVTAAAPTTTQLGITLPIASNLGATEDCAGSGSEGLQSVMILGDAANNRAQLQYDAATTGARTVYFQFAFEVI